jgi:hypothetical protein
VSPILTRPVREQLEHDRVIRQLQARYKRKNEVIINPGNEQNQSITVENLVVFPDLLLFAEGGRRLMGTVEVETGESVNAIEARAEWGVYSKIKVPLHLYVPPACVDAAKRICAEYQIVVSELWTYTTSFDQVRFTLVHRDAEAPVVRVPVKIAKPAPKPLTPKPTVAKPIAPKATAAPTLRQAQGRPEQGRGTKPTPAAKKAAPAKAKPKAKAKPAAKKTKPAPTLRQAQGRPEQGRGTKAKPKKGAKQRR